MGELSGDEKAAIRQRVRIEERERDRIKAADSVRTFAWTFAFVVVFVVLFVNLFFGGFR